MSKIDKVFNSDIESIIGQIIEQILEDFSMRMRMVRKTLVHLQTFISGLNKVKLAPLSMANDSDVEKNKRFQ